MPLYHGKEMTQTHNTNYNDASSKVAGSLS